MKWDPKLDKEIWVWHTASSSLAGLEYEEQSSQTRCWQPLHVWKTSPGFRALRHTRHAPALDGALPASLKGKIPLQHRHVAIQWSDNQVCRSVDLPKWRRKCRKADPELWHSTTAEETYQFFLELCNLLVCEIELAWRCKSYFNKYPPTLKL